MRVDLVLWATENLKSPIILTIYLKMIEAKYTLWDRWCRFYVGSYSIGDRTRAFLKVQDGCDECTYCTIPLAREVYRVQMN
jgi:threonylcarbamoyladenosine tRNA methylthiotransferase MtaB